MEGKGKLIDKSIPWHELFLFLVLSLFLSLSLKKKASVVSPTAATFYFYKSFWIVLGSWALATPQLGFHELNGRKSCWTWPKPPRPSPEPCWTWPGSAPKPPGTFSQNPVEPNVALHQSLPHLLLNLTWLYTKASHTFSWTWPGSAPKPATTFSWTWPGSTPKPPRPSPEPSLEPRWTWPGACTSAHQSYSGLKTPWAYAVEEKQINK